MGQLTDPMRFAQWVSIKGYIFYPESGEWFEQESGNFIAKDSEELYILYWRDNNPIK